MQQPITMSLRPSTQIQLTTQQQDPAAHDQDLQPMLLQLPDLPNAALQLIMARLARADKLALWGACRCG